MDPYSELCHNCQAMKNINVTLLEEKRSLLIRLAEMNNLCASLQAQIEDHERSYERFNDVHGELQSSSRTTAMLEIRCQELEKALHKRTTELIEAKEEIIRLREEGRAHMTSDTLSCSCAAHPTNIGQRPSLATVDEVEALKHQLVVYQEDFHSEKQDKEKAQAEVRVVKAKLREAEDFIHHLKQEMVRYENALRGLTNDKDALKRQVRRLSTSSLPLSPVHRPFQEKWNFEGIETLGEEDVIARNVPKPSLVRMTSKDMCNADVVRG